MMNLNENNNPDDSNLFKGVERLIKNNKRTVTIMAFTALIVSDIILNKDNKEHSNIHINPDSTQNEQVNNKPIQEDDYQTTQPNTETIGSLDDTDYTEIYNDPGSGEKVITKPNKTPENVMGHDIVTLGFTKLIDRGVSKSQVDKLKLYFLDYSNTLETPINEISISTDSIGKLVDEGLVNIDFEITIDRKDKLTAEVQYLGFDDPSLKLFKNGSLVFNTNK